MHYIYALGTDVAVASTNGTYRAFPGLAEASNGDLIAAYRSGATHTSFDGDIKAKISSNGGATWGSEATIVSTATDLRDPDLATLADGTLICSYTDHTTQAPDDYVAYTVRSFDDGATWDTPVALPALFDLWTFACSKVVELSGGDLVLAVYGLNSGDTYESSVVATSTDGGDTWSSLATIVDGESWGRMAAEPYLWRNPETGVLWCAIRSDTATAGIYFVTSTDGGATWSSPGSPALTNVSGRPAFCIHGEDLVLLYRDLADSSRGKIKYSADSGATWSSALVLNSVGAGMYGSFVNLAASGLCAVWATEISSTWAAVVFQPINDIGIPPIDTPVSSLIVAQSPSFYYRLGERSPQNPVVAYGTGTAVLAGGYTWQQTGALLGDPDTALLLHSNTGRFTTTRASLTSSHSYLCWIKTTSTDTTTSYAGNPPQTIFGDTTANVWEGFGTSGANIQFRRFNGSTWQTFTGGTTINDGNWHMVAVTYDAGTKAVELYVDGADDGGGTMSVHNAQGGVNIIGCGYGTADFFAGTLDEVAAFPSALSASTIAEMWAAAPVAGYAAVDSSVEVTSDLTGSTAETNPSATSLVEVTTTATGSIETVTAALTSTVSVDTQIVALARTFTINSVVEVTSQTRVPYRNPAMVGSGRFLIGNRVSG